MARFEPSGNDRAFGGLRIAVGALFLIFAEYKLAGSEFIHGGGFQNWIHLFLRGGAYPFMRPVLTGFVLAHGTPIAYLVAYGELCIGLALVLGILVRPASICGVIYMLTLMASSNYPGPHVPPWRYFGASLDHSVLALCFVAFTIGDADLAYSIPAILRRRARARMAGTSIATGYETDSGVFGK
ncbi:MAG TPA: DoxX family membrane protein [Candidatus Acidoferrales bacterium]|nr:DoxX family membrane protein [Candidatus Acidoferrales bacterium]